MTIGRSSVMTRGMTLLFAVAGGVAVGNLYWAQPLLAKIADALHVSLATAGVLITATQLGYAVGVLLIVPLGDTLNRRRLIPIVMTVSSMALLLCAAAPTYVVLLSGLALVGLSTVSGQLLVPLAGDLANEAERGQVVGAVASGLLTGILLSRTISGLLADTLGWRAIYFAAAIVTLLLAVILGRWLPGDPPRERKPYGQLLTSIAAVVGEHRSVQVTLGIGACTFCVFTMFWTGLTFLLSSPPFSYSATRIGLVGLVGLAGALAAKRAGKLHDRGWSTIGTGAALTLALVALAIAGLGAVSIASVLAAVLLIDIAIQAVNVLNQTRLFAIDPASRSRLNTAFVVCNFLGGATGSALAGVLWHAGGWSLLIVGQAAIIAFALLIWSVNRLALDGVVRRSSRS